jgi:chromosome segregation ATPase
MHAHQAQLEEEIRILKAKNVEMENQLKGYDNANANGDEIASVRTESERYKEEADSLRYQLTASQADAADASKLAEELQAAQSTSTEELERRESELRDVRRELKMAEERATGELEAAMEAKTAELRDLQEKIEKSEAENQQLSTLVDDLSEAGQVSDAERATLLGARLTSRQLSHSTNQKSSSKTTRSVRSKRNSPRSEKNVIKLKNSHRSVHPPLRPAQEQPSLPPRSTMKL